MTPLSVPTNTVETADAAARRYAAQLERLRAGLHHEGITETTWTSPIPAADWPVTAALRTIESLRYERHILADARDLLASFIGADPIPRPIRDQAEHLATTLTDLIGAATPGDPR